MNHRIKPVTSLVTLMLFGLAAVCDANAETVRARQHANEQIRVCIAEIARHADYSDASRVLHWVAEIDQKNPVEMQIRIETSVYLRESSAVGRVYSANCITGGLGSLVRFRIDPVDSSATKGPGAADGKRSK